MKLLLYGINYSPELTGIGKYTGEMATWLAARGHSVRVVTAPPYYPEWRIRPGYQSRRYSHEVLDGVSVLRCPLWVPSIGSGAKRLVHLASFALSSLPALLMQWRWRPDVVWVVEPALFCAPAAIGLARLAGGKAWLHIQDYEVDAAFDMGLLKGRTLRRWVGAAERWLMRRFDRVSTISGRMFQRALAKGVASERAISFPNWVDTSVITPLSGASPFQAELGIAPHTVVALYSGNMGNKQGLEVLAEVAAQLQNEQHLVFVFCGDGVGKEDLVRRCYGLTNVRFAPLQPIERLGDLLGLADIHLLPQRADAADLVMPSKLTGMLASGRAVLATAAPNTELAQVVCEHAKCGMVVAPEDAGAMARAILRLSADPECRARMGASGRAYAERALNREAVLRRFESNLLACVEGDKEA